MFLSSNPNERCHIALKLSVWLNNMKPLIFNCFLPYGAANSGMTCALSGLSEAPTGTGGGGCGCGKRPRWLGHPGFTQREMSFKELAQAGQGQPAGLHSKRQLFCLQGAYICISTSKWESIWSPATDWAARPFIFLKSANFSAEAAASWLTARSQESCREQVDQHAAVCPEYQTANSSAGSQSSAAAGYPGTSSTLQEPFLSLQCRFSTSPLVSR